MKNASAEVVIIGGGAAGIAAAIASAERGRQTLLLERNARIGKKILQTGNGKCNLGSRPFEFERYNDQNFAKYFFAEVIRPDRVYSFLEESGIYLKVREGRIYPYSEQASGVLNALRNRLEGSGAEIQTDFTVKAIHKTDCGFSIEAMSGARAEGCSVVLAVGSPAGGGEGRSVFLYEPYGHRVRPFCAALCPILTDPEPIRGWRGIRHIARCTLFLDGKERGSVTDEVLFKDNGLSGTAIFALSSVLARESWEKFSVVLDFVPEISREEWGRLVKKFPLSAFFHKEIAAKLSKLEPYAAKAYRIEGRGFANFDLAQVASGGLCLQEFIPNTLESRRCCGLYAAGEALDLDGACGGYNLTWAFASGLVAGEHA